MTIWSLPLPHKLGHLFLHLLSLQLFLQQNLKSWDGGASLRILSVRLDGQTKHKGGLMCTGAWEGGRFVENKDLFGYSQAKADYYRCFVKCMLLNSIRMCRLHSEGCLWGFLKLCNQIFVVFQRRSYPKIITVAPLVWFEQLLFRHVQKRERHTVDLQRDEKQTIRTTRPETDKLTKLFQKVIMHVDWSFRRTCSELTIRNASVSSEWWALA